MSLSIIDLTKAYGSQKAVDCISFEAKKGEIMGFLGPNGAGKSTTMKIATGYLTPTSGSVQVCGFDVATHSMEVRRRVGYLPEHNPLYLDMYVRECLKFSASLHGIPAKQAKQQVAEVIELVGLSKEAHKPIGALSKGYRQRVGLAQALLHSPEVLILDEPTTGLDPNQILEIRAVIKNVSADKTVIFSTHIMQEVQALCDRVVIINNGKLVANSPIGELAEAGQRVRVRFEGAYSLDPFQNLPQVAKTSVADDGTCHIFAQPNCDIRGDIFRMAAAQGMVLIEMAQEQESLEQQFKRLTAQEASSQ